MNRLLRKHELHWIPNAFRCDSVVTNSTPEFPLGRENAVRSIVPPFPKKQAFRGPRKYITFLIALFHKPKPPFIRCRSEGITFWQFSPSVIFSNEKTTAPSQREPYKPSL